MIPGGPGEFKGGFNTVYISDASLTGKKKEDLLANPQEC